MSVLRCREAAWFHKCEVPRRKPRCKYRCTDSARASVVNPVHLGCIEPALCTPRSQLVCCTCTAGCQMFQKVPINGWNHLFFIWTKFLISVDNICSQFSVGKISSLLFLSMLVVLLPWKWLLILRRFIFAWSPAWCLAQRGFFSWAVGMTRKARCWHHFRFLTAVNNG